MENLTYIYLNILSKSLKRGYVSHVKSHINLLVYKIALQVFFSLNFREADNGRSGIWRLSPAGSDGLHFRFVKPELL